MPTEAPRQLSTHHQGYEVSVEEEGSVQRREAPADRSPQWLSGLASEDNGVAAGLGKLPGDARRVVNNPRGKQQLRRSAMATLLVVSETDATNRESTAILLELLRGWVGRYAAAVGALISPFGQ